MSRFCSQRSQYWKKTPVSAAVYISRPCVFWKRKKTKKTTETSTDKFVRLNAAILCLIVPSASRGKQTERPSWQHLSRTRAAPVETRLLSFYPGHALAIVFFRGRPAGPRPRHRVRGSAAQNLINKYLLFYGHFLHPAMQTPFPPLANCAAPATYHFMGICKLSNPVLFAGF